MSLITDVRPVVYDALETVHRDNQRLQELVEAAEKTIHIIGFVAGVLDVSAGRNPEGLIKTMSEARDYLLHAAQDYWNNKDEINERERLRKDDRAAASEGVCEPVRQV